MKYILTIIIALTANCIIGQTECGLSNDEINTIFEKGPIDYNPDVSTGVISSPKPPGMSPNPTLYNKIVTWVHGMNGSSSSWSHAALWAKEKYNIKDIRPDYSGEQQTMDQVVNSLSSEIENGFAIADEFILEENIFKCFGIGHSLGGIAVRKVCEKFDHENLNGLISFNSPHGGSRLAEYVKTINGGNSYDEEKVQDLKDLMVQACQNFGAGEVAEFIEFNSGADALEALSFEYLDFSDIFENNVCSLSEAAAPFIISNIAPQCVSELKIGSDALKIEDGMDQEHKMLFYSNIITDPSAHNSAYKMFFSAQNSPDDYATFTAHEQIEESEEAYTTNKNSYNDKVNLYRNWYDEKPIYEFDVTCAKTFVPILGMGTGCLTWGDIKELADEFERGFDYFDVFNDYWEFVCGARKYNYDGGYCYHDDLGLVNWINNPEDCSGFGAEWIGIISESLEDYDGLLTVKSQKDWEGCLDEHKYKLPANSNHLQVKNSSDTEWALKLVFESQGAVFFGL